MVANKDIRHAMIDTDTPVGKLRREVEKRIGDKVTASHFSKILGGERTTSLKAQLVLRTAREILAEKMKG